MRLPFLVLLASCMLHGQTCVSSAALPVGKISSQLDGTSCSLSDSTSYQSFQVVYPVRGIMQASVDAGPATLGLILRDSTGTQIAAGGPISNPVESGTYTLLVNAPTASALSSGPLPFTLQTRFTAEPGMLCTTYPLLGLNQTVSGTLGVSGCVAPDGSPYEA